MSKRELQIPTDKFVTAVTKEEIIFRSPSTIPDKGLRDLLGVKKIMGSDCIHYDISPTENQSLIRGINPNLMYFQVPGRGMGEPGSFGDFASYISSQYPLDMKMGEINE